jgi:ELWxxDGT repeat protein
MTSRNRSQRGMKSVTRSRRKASIRKRKLNVEALENRQLLAGDFQLTEDINSDAQTWESYSRILTIGDNAYFIANSPTTGHELWITDGSENGTRLVKDIKPGNGSSNLVDFTEFQRELYFFASSQTSSQVELWKSDGTGDGTMLVKDFGPQSRNSIGQIRVNDGLLYFAMHQDSTGTELWRSDGTEEGTVLFNDIASGPASSFPQGFVSLGGMLYFSADDATHGMELWRVNGDSLESFDINTETSQGSAPSSFAASGQYIYFSAMTATSGRELWVIDTLRNDFTPTMVADIAPGSASSDPIEFVRLNGNTFFRATTVDRGTELWTTTGVSGATLVVDAAPGAESLFPNELTISNGYVFFVGRNASRMNDLWRSDGTANGTIQVTQADESSIFNVNGLLFSFGDRIYFGVDDGVHGTEIWSVNSANLGMPILLGDLSVGSADSLPYNFTQLGERFVFMTSADVPTSRSLWISDGSSANTQLIKGNGRGTNDSSPTEMIDFQGSLYFVANSSTVGSELFQANPLAMDAIKLVKDVAPGLASSRPRNLTVFQEQLYFTAMGADNVVGLWRTDGTDIGTVLIKSIGGTDDGTVINNTEWMSKVLGNRLVFVPFSSHAGFELWASDGTAEGTVALTNLRPALSGHSPTRLTVVGDVAYFRGKDVSTGSELWRTDGTIAGTRRVADINQGPNGSYPDSMSAFNGELYFSAFNPQYGRELWKSDGTAVGTTLVKDITPGPGSTVLGYLTNANGILIFGASDGAHGVELWKSDGTAENTLMVKDLVPGSGHSYIRNPTHFRGMTYFSATNGLWKTDGTEGGTTLVSPVVPLALSNAGDRLFFYNVGGDAGEEPWISDGTSEGTRPLPEVAQGTGGSLPSMFIRSGDFVYSAMTSEEYGRELFVRPFNFAPTDLVLSNSLVVSGMQIGSSIGRFIATDPDLETRFTYSFVEGNGATDNASFAIEDGVLKAAQAFDHAMKKLYSIRVKVIDEFGDSFEKRFSIRVVNQLVGMHGKDQFSLAFSDSGISIVQKLENGVSVDHGLFALNRPLRIKNLDATDELIVLGTTNDDRFSLANQLVVNDTVIRFDGTPRIKLVGLSGDDSYRFDADFPLGSIELVESGIGNDTINFELTASNTQLDLSRSGIQTVNANLSLSLNVPTRFENASGGDGSDMLSGNSNANRLVGNGGPDTIDGKAGDDVLIGGRGSDVISGGRGSDVLDGGAGDDSMTGGLGDDIYVFSNAVSLESDMILEFQSIGIDTLDFSNIVSSVGIDIGSTEVQVVHRNRKLKLKSTRAIENVIGGEGNDRLIGNNANNLLVGNGGNDAIFGIDGRDILIGGLGTDLVDGGSGEDILIAGFTAYDSNLQQLNATMRIWCSEITFDSRIETLRNTTGLENIELKSGSTVFDDTSEDVDTLLGSSDRDWFFKSLTDLFPDSAVDELIDLLGNGN